MSHQSIGRVPMKMPDSCNSGQHTLSANMALDKNPVKNPIHSTLSIYWGIFFISPNILAEKNTIITVTCRENDLNPNKH